MKHEPIYFQPGAAELLKLRDIALPGLAFHIAGNLTQHHPAGSVFMRVHCPNQYACSDTDDGVLVVNISNGKVARFSEDRVVIPVNVICTVKPVRS